MGCTGVKQILELYKQMKKKAGKYQIKKEIEFGLCANMVRQVEGVILIFPREEMIKQVL